MFIVEAHPQRKDPNNTGLFLFTGERDYVRAGQHLLLASLGAVAGGIEVANPPFVREIVTQMAATGEVPCIPRPFVPAVGAIMGGMRQRCLNARQDALIQAAVAGSLPPDRLMTESEELRRLRPQEPSWLTKDGWHGTYSPEDQKVVPIVMPLSGSPVEGIPTVRTRAGEWSSTYFVHVTALVHNTADPADLPEPTDNRYVMLGNMTPENSFQSHAPVPLPNTL